MINKAGKSVVVSEDFIARSVLDDFSFTVSTQFITVSGTTETPILLLKNPSANTVRFLISHFVAGTDSATARTIWRAYKNCTTSDDGTALPIENANFADDAEASKMEAFKLPTVTDNGSFMNMKIFPNNGPSGGVSRWYRVPPGKNCLVTIENSIANAKSFADIYFVELP